MKTRKKTTAKFKDGNQIVVLPRQEYERLMQKADEWEPPLPALLPDGNYPAVEYARASLAREIIRHRRKLGLTQLELARRAGIKLEALCRIERALVSASVAMVDKIDKALEASKFATS